MTFNFNKPIILENDRVRLEPLDTIHLEPLTPIAINNPDLLQYSPPNFGTVQFLNEYIHNNIALRQKQAKYPFAIFDKLTNSYAGSTSYMSISSENSRLEIGSTWIGKEFQRTGLNRNCKFLLLTYVFEVLEFERVELKTDARNTQSRKGIEGIGGIYEGQLRNHTVLSDGFRRDTVYYSILKDEWNTIKSTIFKDFKC